MSGPASNARGDPEWAEGLRREMQRVIGHMFRLECKLPQELAPELATHAPGDLHAARLPDLRIVIHMAAAKAYRRGRKGSYELIAADF